MKKIISIILLCASLIMLVSCFDVSAKPKEFSVSQGLKLTLTDDFKETEIEGYTVSYDSAKIAVFTLEEKFSLVDGFENYTIKQYGEAVRTANNTKDPTELKTEDGLTFFEYTFHNDDENEDYHYYSYVFKEEDAFWLVQFACLEDNAEELKGEIANYAKSVTFE